MYVCELDRPWVETSFLFQGFRITNDQELVQLAETCEFVYVDSEKSHVDVTSHRRAPSSRGAPRKPRRSLLSRLRRQSPPPRRSFEEELPVARRIFSEVQVSIQDVFADVRLGRSLDVSKVRPTVHSIADSVMRHPDAMKLLCALEKKDEDAVAHALSVCVLSLAFGRHIGMAMDQLHTLGFAALLHDIGELRLPERLMHKPGGWSDGDFDEAKRHTEYGVELLRKSEGIPAGVIEVARDHHERVNRSGYPRQLGGDEIGTFTKIVGIVDVYDAVTKGLEGKPAVSFTDALKSMYDWRDQLFDSELVEQFIQCLGIYPVGSVVELNSGEIGIVISLAPTVRLAPKVMLVRNRNKKPYHPPRIVNLAKFIDGDDEEASYRYEIRSVVSAQDYSVDVRHYVLRELYQHQEQTA
jgi:putative nucleotidyltransferase with HDIG domain